MWNFDLRDKQTITDEYSMQSQAPTFYAKLESLPDEDCDKENIKKELKDKKATFVAAFSTRINLNGNVDFIIIGKDGDEFKYWHYNDASGLFWEHKGFPSRNSAISDASCNGYFEQYDIDSNHHVFESIFTSCGGKLNEETASAVQPAPQTQQSVQQQAQKLVQLAAPQSQIAQQNNKQPQQAGAQ